MGHQTFVGPGLKPDRDIRVASPEIRNIECRVYFDFDLGVEFGKSGKDRHQQVLRQQRWCRNAHRARQQRVPAKYFPLQTEDLAFHPFGPLYHRFADFGQHKAFRLADEQLDAQLLFHRLKPSRHR